MSNYTGYPASRPQRPTAILFLAYLTLLAVAGFFVWRFWPERGNGIDEEATLRPVTPRGEFKGDEKANIELIKRASPSVVHITSMAVRRDRFSFDTQQIPQGTGSGIVWDKKGHIVTNYHVVKGARAAKVTLADHTTLEARQLFFDEEKDLAVLWIKTSADRLKPIPVGQSSDLQVGQYAVAIGNPFGLDHTVTLGIISAVGRQIGNIKGAIQTDAAINPGNSGGPLLDSSGRLIGVNTAIISPSGTSAGIGFAIPVDEVNRVVTQLIKHGKVIRPGLGIQEAPDQLARHWGIPGVLILNVDPDGPAAKAGLQPTRRDDAGHIHFGDAIVAIDGKDVNSPSQLFAILDQHAVGDEVDVTIWRDGERFHTKLRLAEAQGR
jgi:S1-C subfamily serine protease